MTTAGVTALPNRRPDLVIRAVANVGRYVVKDPRHGTYFQIGEEEHFLLTQLDGCQSAQAVCQAFELQFGQALPFEELREFVMMAGQSGLLTLPSVGVRNATVSASAASATIPSRAMSGRSRRLGQCVLSWRKSLFDPDWLFTRIEPACRLFWTRGFVLASALCIVLAAIVLWQCRHTLAADLVQLLRWETLLWSWLAVGSMTLIHESAHGLTCKHYGGEVREIGFLLLLFMPCFYCNVSDAWLFPQKSRRMWVTLAGGYFELFVWALAVFVWRGTLPGSFPHDMALLIVLSSGIDALLNFNPLLKLDGYYLLSDWLEIPNLRQRSWTRFQALTRHWLWGAAPPAAVARGRLLATFGAMSWGYSLLVVCLSCFALLRWSGGSDWCHFGLLGAGLLIILTVPALCSDFARGEIGIMLRSRPFRLLCWGGVIGLLMSAVIFLETVDWATGPFTLRAERRSEVQAPVTGFLREVYVDEGDHVEAGQVLFRIEDPDLQTRLGAKRAERDAVAAQLAALQAGTRCVDLLAQQERVAVAQKARDLAERHLQQDREAHAAHSDRLANQVAIARSELKALESNWNRTTTLRTRNAVSASDVDQAEAEWEISRSRLQSVIAEHRAHIAEGVREAESELAICERAFTTERLTLGLMHAGSRTEDIAAQQSRLRQLDFELEELEHVSSRQIVCAPFAGVVLTPQVMNRSGQFVPQGTTICEIADSSQLIADIALPEHHAARVGCGQAVCLQPRALALDEIETSVTRTAVSGQQTVEHDPQAPCTVSVLCRLDLDVAVLRPGMTGHAWINTGQSSILDLVSHRARQLLRTEFWW